MMQNQSPLEHPTGNPKTAGFLKNSSALKNLVGSPDTKKLIDLLNRSAGGGLKTAAESAMKGDTEELMGLMNQLLKDPEGAKIVQNINDSMPR